MNRRSFFNRIARAAAIVALAPQIAFRAKPLEFVSGVLQFGDPSPLNLSELLEACYKLKRDREAAGTADQIDWVTDSIGKAWIERKAQEEFVEDFFFRTTSTSEVQHH